MTVLAVVLLLFGAQSAADMPATILDLYHGDTLRVEASPWPGKTVHTLVRIRGVAAAGPGAGCRTAGMAADRGGDIGRLAGRTIMLHDLEQDGDGGRMRATMILPDGRDLADVLVTAGLAHPAGGARPPSGCADAQG